MTFPLHHIRHLFLFALPLCAASITNMMINFLSMFMVAKLGETELAAGALASGTYITITMVLPIFYSIGILISHHRGQGKPAADIGDIVKNGFWLALTLALPTCLLLWHADAILYLFNQDPELIKRTETFFHFAALGMPAIFIYTVSAQFYVGIGFPKFTFYITLLNLPVTLLLAYGFIFGEMGLPALGLGGITCATFISQSIITIGILFFLYKGKEAKKYHIFAGKWQPNFILYKKMLTLGYPIGLQFGGELSAMTIATYFLGYYGKTVLAASQIATQYALLIVMSILGLSQALSILVSEAYGKNNLIEIKKNISAGIIILSIFFVFVLSSYLLIPDYLIRVFTGQTHDPVLFHYATIFFIISGVTLYADGLRNLFTAGLRGLHDSKIAMIVGILSLWMISLPLSYIVGFLFDTGPVGLRLGFMCGFMVAAIVLWGRMRKKLGNADSISIKALEKEVPSSPAFLAGGEG